MVDILVPQTLMAVPSNLVAVLSVSLVSILFMRKVALDRPAVGVFNGRDIVVLYIFIVSLPTLYLFLPQWALTGFLIVTFMAALSIGYKPVVPRAVLWPAIGLLIGFNIWVARTMLGTVPGWQLMLVMNSLLVLLAAVAVANLYVQGGMKLKHVAYFTLTLGLYDLAFLPFTVQLADAFIGKPLNPAMGMRISVLNVDIGLGDVLVYALFTLTMLKAYGPRAAKIGMVVIVVFGATIPPLSALLVAELVRGGGNVVAPAQFSFGLAAFATYLIYKRRFGPERTYAQFRRDPYGNVLPLKKRTDAAAADRPVSPAPTGQVPDEAPVGATGG